MEDKCPKCGNTLITKTITKELALGSIDYPVAQVCPNCNWTRDLTGASDIIYKPSPMEKSEIRRVEEKPKAFKPPKAQPKPGPSVDINKIVPIVLAIIVLLGLVWAFYQPSQKEVPLPPTPTPTPTVTATTSSVISTPVPEITPTVYTPTGKSALVKLDYYRGFLPVTQTIKPGDEIRWENYEVETLTLVSSENLFDPWTLPYGKRATYIFKKTGTYKFYLKENNTLNGIIVVEP